MALFDLKPIHIEPDYAARDAILKQQVLAHREAVRKGTMRVEDLEDEARRDMGMVGLWAGARAAATHTFQRAVQTRHEPEEGA